MAELAQEADHFAPPEALLDQFPLALTKRVPGMPSGARIERTRGFGRVEVRRHVGRGVQRAHRRDEVRLIIAFVSPEGCVAVLGVRRC
jgi:hypothetical protein